MEQLFELIVQHAEVGVALVHEPRLARSLETLHAHLVLDVIAHIGLLVPFHLDAEDGPIEDELLLHLLRATVAQWNVVREEHTALLEAVRRFLAGRVLSEWISALAALEARTLLAVLLWWLVVNERVTGHNVVRTGQAVSAVREASTLPIVH